MEQICQEKIFNVPNVLTMIRIILLPIIAWYYKMGNMVSALIVYLIAMLTDAVDGAIARKTNQITSFGKLLDPIADKLSLVTLLALFVGDEKIPVWVLAAIVIKEMIMVIGSGIAFKNGIIVYALPIGKVTTLTFVVSIVARFLNLTLAADMLMYVSVLLSVIALIWYCINGAMKLEEKKKVHSRAVR